MKTDPFANIPLDPAVLKQANAVRDRMSHWIDDEVGLLKKRMGETAAIKAQNVADSAQKEFGTMLDDAERQLMAIQANLAAIKVKFTDPGLQAQSDALDQAIISHQTAIREQRAKIQQYGQALGGVIQKAFLI